jgi:hypothetical protein
VDGEEEKEAGWACCAAFPMRGMGREWKIPPVKYGSKQVTKLSIMVDRDNFNNILKC